MVKPLKNKKNINQIKGRGTNSTSLKPRENPMLKRTLVRDSGEIEDFLNDLFDEIIKESKGFDDAFCEYSTIGEMLGLSDEFVPVDNDYHIALDIDRLLNDNAAQSVTFPDFQI